jgi:hypothetical protein
MRRSNVRTYYAMVHNDENSAFIRREDERSAVVARRSAKRGRKPASASEGSQTSTRKSLIERLSGR